jgi:hypothetical protein
MELKTCKNCRKNLKCPAHPYEKKHELYEQEIDHPDRNKKKEFPIELEEDIE